MRPNTRFWLLVTASAVVASLAACPPPPRSTEAPRPTTTVDLGADDVVEGDNGFRETYLTVMPNNLALVRDRRAASLPSGVSAVSYGDVLDTVIPESTRARFRPRRGDAFDVRFIEQRYRYDVIEPGRIAELSLGGTVRLRWTHPRSGEERTLEGVVESTEHGLFIRTPDGTLTLATPDANGLYSRAIFDDLPGALFSRPVLDWIVDARAGGPGILETSYLARGFSWEADYVVSANDEFSKADILGWVTLRNFTGGRFDRAHLAVVAGEIHMATPAADAMFLDDTVLYAAEGDGDGDYGYVQEGLFEYHMYRLEKPATLDPYSWKQVAFLERNAISITTRYRADIALQPGAPGHPAGSDDVLHVAVRRLLKIENKADVDGLGIPLPSGTARLYARSGDDVFFIAADRVKDTPREEPIELDAGGAPFVVVGYKVTDVSLASAGRFGSFTVVRHVVTAVNRGARPVRVLFRLALPGAGGVYPYYGGGWDARLQRAPGVIGPAIEEVESGVWEMERVLEPDVEARDELVLRLRMDR